MKYLNPILPGFYPDPSVCRVGDDFYMVTSSFEYFPGVPVFHSRDLVNWTQIGHCLTRKSQLNLDGVKASGGIFAPTIRYHDGRFYMITTDTTGIRNFIVHAEDPAGEWSEPVLVDQGGIDPSLYWDDDGQCYFSANALWTNLERGLYLTKINPDTGELGPGPTQRLWDGTGGKYPEAPHIYQKDNWYYLLIAEGGTEFGHMISIARSRAIDGPYESCPHNPLLSHRSSANAIQSTGHADFFEDGHGNWWTVFLAVRHLGYPLVHHLGRETYLAPVDWDADGWPWINQGRLVDLRMELDRPGVEQTEAPERGFFDNFDAPELDLSWNFCRNPQADSWSLSEPAGQLSLRCLPENLDGRDAKSWLGRRQQHFYAKAETQLHFTPQGAEEAGLTAYMNERCYIALGYTQKNGQCGLMLRRVCGSLRSDEFTPIAAQGVEGGIRIELTASEEILSFAYYRADGVRIELGGQEPRLLSTEIAGGFTGLYWALYATANGAESPNVARFDYFNYQPEGHPAEWDRCLEPVTAKPKETDHED